MRSLFSPRWLPPVTEEERTRTAVHEITQTSQPNHQHTEDFLWHGLKLWTPFPQKELMSLRQKQHNWGAPTGTTDHSPGLWERGNVSPQGFILGCEEGTGWDVGALLQRVRMQHTFYFCFCYLCSPYSQTQQAKPGLSQQSPEKALQKPRKPLRAVWRPQTPSAQGEPAQGNSAGDR